MAYYLTSDEELLQASNNKELVEKMRSYTNFCQTMTVKQYMDMVAKLVSNIDGKSIRTDNENNFVADLLKTGNLKKMSAQQAKSHIRKGMR